MLTQYGYKTILPRIKTLYWYNSFPIVIQKYFVFCIDLVDKLPASERFIAIRGEMVIIDNDWETFYGSFLF